MGAITQHIKIRTVAETLDFIGTERWMFRQRNITCSRLVPLKTNNALARRTTSVWP